VVAMEADKTELNMLKKNIKPKMMPIRMVCRIFIFS
jgi:hypothetical protein